MISLGKPATLRPRVLALLGALALISLLAAPAAAQRAPTVSATISAEVVEVGEPFLVELKALISDGDLPSDPQLRLPQGLQGAGPQVSSQTMAQFSGGQAIIQQGIGARWQVVASEPGSYAIPAPTVLIGGRIYAAGTGFSIKVLPEGQRPRARQPSSPFGLSFPFQLDFDPQPWRRMYHGQRAQDPANLSPEERQLALRQEPAEKYIFLRAIADKGSAIVGEQITVSFYEYYRINRTITDWLEPHMTDFLRVPLLDDPGTQKPLITNVGPWSFSVRLHDSRALFPLRAGRLSIGQIAATFVTRGQGELQRKSNDITIDVREPPLEGRPAGYRLGDVGKYRLTATVTPRQIEAGGSVAVQVRLTGIGSLPSSLKVPERRGVEWLQPEKRGELKVDDGIVGGWRTFGYVVRLNEAGEVALGRIRLPYYDVDSGQYEVAFAELGTIQVKPARTGGALGKRPDGGGSQPGATAAEDEDDQRDAFTTIAPPRSKLAPYSPQPDEGFNLRTLWALVLSPPLLVLTAAGLRRSSAAWRRRRQERRTDAGALAAQALKDMQKVKGVKDTAAAAERAVHLAIEAGTGLKSRAVLLDDLPGQLAQRGVAAALSAEVGEVLQQTSALRFEVDAAGGSADSAAAAGESGLSDLKRRAQGVVKQLVKLRANGGGNGGSSNHDRAPQEEHPT